MKETLRWVVIVLGGMALLKILLNFRVIAEGIAIRDPFVLGQLATWLVLVALAVMLYRKRPQAKESAGPDGS